MCGSSLQCSCSPLAGKAAEHCLLECYAAATCHNLAAHLMAALPVLGMSGRFDLA